MHRILDIIFVDPTNDPQNIKHKKSIEMNREIYRSERFPLIL